MLYEKQFSNDEYEEFLHKNSIQQYPTQENILTRIAIPSNAPTTKNIISR